jgi:hypothetical protein
MQGAFVVCLGSQGEQSREELEGRIEEVDSGKSIRFHSGEELIEFLRSRQKDALTGQEKRPVVGGAVTGPAAPLK